MRALSINFEVTGTSEHVGIFIIAESTNDEKGQLYLCLLPRGMRPYG